MVAAMAGLSGLVLAQHAGAARLDASMAEW
jgi:hypothetical protein